MLSKNWMAYCRGKEAIAAAILALDEGAGRGGRSKGEGGDGELHLGLDARDSEVVGLRGD